MQLLRGVSQFGAVFHAKWVMGPTAKRDLLKPGGSLKIWNLAGLTSWELIRTAFPGAIARGHICPRRLRDWLSYFHGLTPGNQRHTSAEASLCNDMLKCVGCCTLARHHALQTEQMIKKSDAMPELNLKVALPCRMPCPRTSNHRRSAIRTKPFNLTRVTVQEPCQCLLLIGPTHWAI